MSHHSDYRQRHSSDPSNIDLSRFDYLAQEEVGHIPLEQLTKSEQVQPWNGQAHHGSLYGQVSGTGWQLSSNPRPGALTEPIQIGRHALPMQRTSSYDPSNADSGYVSQPVSANPELDDNGLKSSFAFSSSPYSPLIANDGAWPSVPRTVVSEGDDRPVNVRGSRKPSMTPCPHPGCGRQPKNHSDARKHAETHLKRHLCNAYGCTRKDGFATLNDLERHKKSVHCLKPAVGNPTGYICRACIQQSEGKETKFWPRRDNYKAHIRRKHANWDENQLLEASKSQRPHDAMTADMDTNSAVSFIERQSEPSHIDHNEPQFYQTHFGDRSHDQQVDHLSHPDDWQLFPGSDMQDNTLTAMGGAMENDMSYHAWSPQLDSVREGSPPPESHPSQFYIPPHDEHNERFDTIDIERDSRPFSYRTIQALTTTTNDSSSQVRFTTAANHNNHQCPSCHKFHKRSCDLKKHIKRHTRPYGCTFCRKRFGSRNDWKRHEGSQHQYIGDNDDDDDDDDREWVSPFVSAGGRGRGKGKGDGCVEMHRLSEKASANRINGIGGISGVGNFWCGFCAEIIIFSRQHQQQQRQQQQQQRDDIDVRTSAAWNFRIQHIGDHFDKDGKHIDEWIRTSPSSDDIQVKIQDR